MLYLLMKYIIRIMFLIIFSPFLLIGWLLFGGRKGDSVYVVKDYPTRFY